MDDLDLEFRSEQGIALNWIYLLEDYADAAI